MPPRATLMMGVETEYAVSAARAGSPAAPAAEDLVRRARARHAHLPDAQGGLFLENGARLYLDCGAHPEYATPECTDPWELARHVLAGELIVGRLAGASADVFKSNVDYSGAQTTWGCHESYLHRADPASLSAQVIPHLVSRIVYTGAGGFDSLAPGLEFTLSPRVPHLTSEVSGESTTNRGIFHTKDEPHARAGFHRLHVICGESLSSETAMVLKVGATALVVAMAEQGLRLAEGFTPTDPLQAMRDFAADPECRATARTGFNRQRTALEIQRHYLGRAEAHASDSFMPPWAADLCRLWRRTLEALEAGPGGVGRTLDWAVKLALFRDHARRGGFEWDEVSVWSYVHRELRTALGAAGYHNRAVSVDFVLGPESPITETVRRVERYLVARGLAWRRLGEFLSLRQQLFEIDTRFSQLGGAGLFAQLDAAGVLDHRVEGVGDAEPAVTTPPARGRARLRGEQVRRNSGARRQLVCDWSRVVDYTDGRLFDLSDPFAEGAGQWREPDDAEQEHLQIYSAVTRRPPPPPPPAPPRERYVCSLGRRSRG